MNESKETNSGKDEQAVRVGQILSYHRLSKHHLHRYAEGPGQLDWANQPDPFRTYDGAPVVDLPLLADAIVAGYRDLYTANAVAPRKPALDTVAILFELSLGLSAWKEYGGSRWALRCTPSSGNLHPTEGYAVLPPLPELEAGVYHYVSRDHRLERRCTFTSEAVTALTQLLPERSFLIGLSSIHWREAWKYGRRAYRYCQHDVGHALAAIRYAAAILGWSARLLDDADDDEIAALMGLDRDADVAAIDALDREHPDLLLMVGPPQFPIAGPMGLSNAKSSATQFLSLTKLNLAAGPGAVWAGKANPLSRDHVRWEAIDLAATATRGRTVKLEAGFNPPSLPPFASRPENGTRALPAATLIRQRRSALAFDGSTPLTASNLYDILDHLIPRKEVPPWDLLPWRPRLHAAIFVHRVSGLQPGLYFLERDSGVHGALRAACRPTFLWRRPPGCPDHLLFYLLAGGDLRDLARTLSCHQEIASDGIFSLGMIAEFGEVIRAGGPGWYRRLFWEAGVLGQVLYLESEAAGVRSTGIGCYFDDMMHEVLGLAGDRFQSLYHFSVGGPIEDSRLRSIPPYAHLVRDARG